MTSEIKQVRMEGAAYSLPHILSFSTEKDFVEAHPEAFLEFREKQRAELLKKMYQEAKRLQKAEAKKEPKNEA